jgi:hypothetical protein
MQGAPELAAKPVNERSRPRKSTSFYHEILATEGLIPSISSFTPSVGNVMPTVNNVAREPRSRCHE